MSEARHRRALPAVLAIAALATGLAACGGAEEEAAAPAAAASVTATATTAADPDAATTGHAMTGATSEEAMAEDATSAATGLEVRPTPFGDAIFTTAGGAIYSFDADTDGTSTCDGTCAEAWPPLIVDAAPMAGAGLDHDLVGTTTRADGRLQATYAGHPLYLYRGDAPGEVACQHADDNGGLWLILNPDGTPNMATEPLGADAATTTGEDAMTGAATTSG